MESPPKRITRARAAAKAAKIVTPAVKAKRTGGTATASTKSTAAKRKTRADENENEDVGQHQQPQQQQQQQQQPQAVSAAGRALRARPRRAAADSQEEAAAPAKVARTRLGSSKSAAGGDASSRSRVGSVAEKPAAAPPRPRGRPRKTPVAEAQDPAPDATEKKKAEDQRQQQQPGAKKTTTATATTRPRPGVLTNGGGATKPAVKKTVKFQEPDKENIGPRAKAKEPVITTGLRGRPARRGVAASTTKTTTTTTRAATRAAAEQKKPLSPKKMTQMPVARDDEDDDIDNSSEDELAAEKTKTSKASPLKETKLSPAKPGPMSPVQASAVTSPFKTSATSPLKLSVTSPVEPLVDDVADASDERRVEEDAEAEEPVLDAGLSLGSTPRRLPSSPFKMKSPAKRIGSVSIPGNATPARTSEVPAFKTPLLQSAAKRPQSPIKGLGLPPMTGGLPPQKTQSAMKSTMFQSPAKRAMPNLKPLTEPRRRGASSTTTTEWPEMQPLLMATPVRPGAALPSRKLLVEEEEDVEEGSGSGDELSGGNLVEAAEVASPLFSGRLSSVVPRHADPTLRAEAATVAQEEDDEIQLMPEPEPEQDAEATEVDQQGQSFTPEKQPEEPPSDVEDGDPMAIDDMAAQMEDSAELTPPSPTTTGSWAQQPTTYELREKDMDPYHDLEWESESDDGLATPREAMAPTPARPMDGRRATMGLTSLAEQFGSWTTASPVKKAQAVDAEAGDATTGGADEVKATDEASCRGSFFEDGLLGIEVDGEQTCHEDEDGDLIMDDIVMTDEDIALAQEANDMSVLGLHSEEAGDVLHSSFDDGLSEASQEYGDENVMPTERIAAAAATSAPMTPSRPQTRMMTFHTTSKVPLKPADESTPSPLKQRSMSVSRAVTTRRRPSGPSRSATVISYSPTKSSDEGSWSTPTPTPTPMTPRRRANATLLQGAVVFVDVHTDEGDDASAIFIELLGQMGARCVKTWDWNPAEGDDDLTEVGITHVVFKDGSKRTLEKVRATGGLVRCVGANWILDCERQGQRLDEAPYVVDTSLVPRGGARRRKSMEPKALAKLNNGNVAGAAAATTPANRRDSTMWMHVPSSNGDGDGGVVDNGDDDDEDLNWSQMMLTPVPKTPAPEAIARYAAELPCDEEGDDEDDYEGGFTPTRDVLATRTCPPKRSQFHDMGEGILGRDKDENVLMRLMAARRKSLQFAPKIASPLSRAWEE
ncbi:hypothetical protein CP532_0152 [Ophiocordyceps camponoti-leonardi (nom. inval.)]|nr:hypothetical protein CP532_0152 [Ophiocordyceps camponoti-leonardi (nom. inval.)]